jgi:hypothetical protein
MSDVDELARIREENRLLIEDRRRFPDRPDAIGRIIDAHHANREAMVADLESRLRGSLTEIARLREERRWIKVTEQTPEQGVDVWFTSTIDGKKFSDAEKGCWRGKWTHSTEAIAMDYGDEDGDWLPCTHWQPLPPGPEGKEKWQ